MKQTVLIRRRERPYREKVLKRYPDGKPMVTGGGVSALIDSPEMIRGMLRNLERDRKELGDDFTKVHISLITTGALGLLKHYNLDDIAKATGLSRGGLYRALKVGETKWEPTFDMIFRIYWVFGMQLKIKIVPDKPIAKKPARRKKT